MVTTKTKWLQILLLLEYVTKVDLLLYMSIVFYQERRANSSESHTVSHKALVQGALIHGDNI